MATKEGSGQHQIVSRLEQIEQTMREMPQVFISSGVTMAVALVLTQDAQAASSEAGIDEVLDRLHNRQSVVTSAEHLLEQNSQYMGSLVLRPEIDLESPPPKQEVLFKPTSNSNVRSGPGVENRDIGDLSSQETYRVLSRYTIDDNNQWLQVSIADDGEDSFGWVAFTHQGQSFGAITSEGGLNNVLDQNPLVSMLDETGDLVPRGRLNTSDMDTESVWAVLTQLEQVIPTEVLNHASIVSTAEGGFWMHLNETVVDAQGIEHPADGILLFPEPDKLVYMNPGQIKTIFELDTHIDLTPTLDQKLVIVSSDGTPLFAIDVDYFTEHYSELEEQQAAGIRDAQIFVPGSSLGLLANSRSSSQDELAGLSTPEGFVPFAVTDDGYTFLDLAAQDGNASIDTLDDITAAVSENSADLPTGEIYFQEKTFNNAILGAVDAEWITAEMLEPFQTPLEAYDLYPVIWKGSPVQPFFTFNELADEVSSQASEMVRTSLFYRGVIEHSNPEFGGVVVFDALDLDSGTRTLVGMEVYGTPDRSFTPLVIVGDLAQEIIPLDPMETPFLEEGLEWRFLYDEFHSFPRKNWMEIYKSLPEGTMVILQQGTNSEDDPSDGPEIRELLDQRKLYESLSKGETAPPVLINGEGLFGLTIICTDAADHIQTELLN